MRQVLAQQGDTVDAICWRELGATRGVVEAVYELNRGIASLGPVLPHGTPVQLPDASAVTPPIIQTTQLWD